MSLWQLPPLVSAVITRMAALLDRRSEEHFWSVVFGLLLVARKRRTVSAWFRAAGIGADFRGAYHVRGSVGRWTRSLGRMVLSALKQVEGDPGAEQTLQSLLGESL